MANETEWSTWKNHQAYTVDFLAEGASDTLDTFLGVVLILCGVIGFPANFLSFIYFINRTTTNISLKLYSVISLTDGFTCLLVLADAKVLFENRGPGWFENIHFCKFWAISFEILSQYSMFLVMMISVTRAITIVKPQYKIDKKKVIICLVLFPCEYILERVIGTDNAVQDMYGFSIDHPFCWVNSYKQKVRTIFKTLTALKICLASIAIFLAYLVSMKALFGGSRAGSMDKIHRASITITLFTLIFLICNIPYFFNEVTHTISVYVAFNEYPPGKKFESFYNFNLILNQHSFLHKFFLPI